VAEDQGGLLAQSVNRREADGIGSWLGSGRLKERASLRGSTRWGFGGHVEREHAFEQLGPAQGGSR